MVFLIVPIWTITSIIVASYSEIIETKTAVFVFSHFSPMKTILILRALPVIAALGVRLSLIGVAVAAV